MVEMAVVIHTITTPATLAYLRESYSDYSGVP